MELASLGFDRAPVPECQTNTAKSECCCEGHCGPWVRAPQLNLTRAQKAVPQQLRQCVCATEVVQEGAAVHPHLWQSAAESATPPRSSCPS